MKTRETTILSPTDCELVSGVYSLQDVRDLLDEGRRITDDQEMIQIATAPVADLPRQMHQRLGQQLIRSIPAKLVPPQLQAQELQASQGGMEAQVREHQGKQGQGKQSPYIGASMKAVYRQANQVWQNECNGICCDKK